MACVPDETISNYVAKARPYHLVEMNDAPTQIKATIEFGPRGKISGQGPCNRYFATSEDPYPWLKIEAIGATKMACPSLKDEQTYFTALQSMTNAEAAGSVLILSNENGENLVYRLEN